MRTTLFPTVFDSFSPFLNEIEKPTTVKVNIKETDTTFEFEVLAPGFKKEEISIELENRILKISAQQEEQEEVKEGTKFLRTEFSNSTFERSFKLPQSILEDNISARMENGILMISVQKVAKIEPEKRTIAIS